MVYNSFASAPKANSAKLETFEILVVCVSEILLAIRANRIQRLIAYLPGAIQPPAAEEPTFPGLLGYFDPSAMPAKTDGGSRLARHRVLADSTQRFPVLALSGLLELPVPANTDAYKQIICIEQNGTTVGFAIEAASEIERANIADVRLLPKWVEESRIKPVVWALWQRTPDDLLPLVEPLEAVNREV